MLTNSHAKPASGDDAAFERLYATHHRAILAYCARRSSLWDAWDAAAEVFLVAWRRMDQMPEGDDTRAWLIGVAYKTLANQRRGDTRRQRLLARASQVMPWAPLPDEQLVRSEEEQQVLEALGRLSPIDREIIQLTLWEELAPVTIAGILGISREAVDQRYARAKKRLGRQLERDLPSRSHATQAMATKGGVT